ncbi:MAG: hypothetical protein HYR63_01835 [Proteobacteria bacterium]|nr:hypothetical protein [Pseudomonadota bacterium]
MRRFFIAAFLGALIVLGMTRSCAAEDGDDRVLGLTNGELAIAVAVVVTTARVAFVIIAGGTLFGRSIGGALLAVYLGHVIAEGVIYGAGAGAGAYVLSSSTAGALAEGEQPPAIDTERLRAAVPPEPRLPLQTAKPHLP